MIALVGYTGFVGSNIHASAIDEIDALYNSKNIADAYDTGPDLLIYAGIRAEKYLANIAPQKDMRIIRQAEENIKRIKPKKLVLISTIDVFKEPKDVDEDSKIDTEGLHAYGANRYQLELWAREAHPDALIVRLPSLFGKNIKKNFIYDYINVIPFMLKKQMMDKFLMQDPELRGYYIPLDNGFYRVKTLTNRERDILKAKFIDIGFSALNFTDSRSRYQFYDLKRLWSDIQTCIKNEIKIWHPATEPVAAGELYQFLTGGPFINELSGTPADYDYKTKYGALFGSSSKYICSKIEVMESIRKFIEDLG